MWLRGTVGSYADLHQASRQPVRAGWCSMSMVFVRSEGRHPGPRRPFLLPPLYAPRNVHDVVVGAVLGDIFGVLFGTQLGSHWGTLGPTRTQVGIGQPVGVPPSPPLRSMYAYPRHPSPSQRTGLKKKLCLEPAARIQEKATIIQNIVHVEEGIQGARGEEGNGGRGDLCACVCTGGSRQTIRTPLAPLAQLGKS